MLAKTSNSPPLRTQCANDDKNTICMGCDRVQKARERRWKKCSKIYGAISQTY